MEFSLQISSDNVSYTELDLFENQQLDYNLDFFDGLDIDKVQIPFSTNIRIPTSSGNISALGYDPLSSVAADFPTAERYFILYIYGATTTQIRGRLTVDSYEYNSSLPYIELSLKDFVTYFINQITGDNLSLLYDASEYTSNRTFSNFKGPFSITDGEAGLIGTSMDYRRPIQFPHVDFNNDIGKFGYEMRQFIEYGPYGNRGGFVPAFSVNEFLELVAGYMSNANLNVRVDSALFGLGDFSASLFWADLQPEKIHFITPAHLRARNSVNTRAFTVRQAPAWTGVNENLSSTIDINGANKLIWTDWFKGMETYGNYNGTEQWSAATIGGYRRRDFYPSDSEGQRGFHAPDTAFNADITLAGGTGPIVIQNLQAEFPVADEDKMVVSIGTPSTTMTFKFYLGVYQDGLLVKKIPFQDVNGDELVLGPSNFKTVRNAVSEKVANPPTLGHYYDVASGNMAVAATAGAVQDTLEFIDFNAYFPDDETIEINAGSEYGVNCFLEPVDGVIQFQYVTAYNGANPSVATSSTFANFGVSQIRKLITRNATSYGSLNVTFTSNADPLPRVLSDQFNIQESIAQTTSLTIRDCFEAIIKRFNCGIFYEYDSGSNEHVLRIDPPHVIRTGTTDINEYVDDLKSVRKLRAGNPIGTVTIKNKDNGFYYEDLDDDGVTYGSTTQVVNSLATFDYPINLESALYYKSVCGPETPVDLSLVDYGAFSYYELGFAANLHTPNKDLGIHFAFLEEPEYTTNLVKPQIRLRGNDNTGQMTANSQLIYNNGVWGRHIFNGRLFVENTAGETLAFQDEFGSPTNTYINLYLGSDQIRYANRPVIQFDMVVPTTELATLDFFGSVLTATDITQDDIYVKSVSGEVFEDFAYVTVEGYLI